MQIQDRWKKKLLTVRAVRCREFVFKVGYEICITTNLKNRRNSVQSMLKSLEAEWYIILTVSISSMVGCGDGSLRAYPEFLLFIHLPHLRMLLCSLFTISKFVLRTLFSETCEVWSRFTFPKKICCLKDTTCWWYQRSKQKETKLSVLFLAWLLTKPITMLEIPHNTF